MLVLECYPHVCLALSHVFVLDTREASTQLDVMIAVKPVPFGADLTVKRGPARRIKARSPDNLVPMFINKVSEHPISHPQKPSKYGLETSPPGPFPIRAHHLAR